MIDVSVIIPVYNYGSLLPRTLDSVLSQDGCTLEIVAVDDGSKDNSWQVLTDFQQKNPNVLHIYQQKNSGAAVARNRGIDNASGRYLLFLDADDQLLPGALGGLLSVAEKSPEAGVVIGGYYVDRDGRRKYRSNKKIPASRYDCFYQFIHNKLAIANGCYLVKREALGDIRFSENLRQAEDLPLRGLLFATADTVFADVPTLLCFRHEGSLRYNLESVEAGVSPVVGELFDAPQMPREMSGLRADFMALQSLSSYRKLIAAGHIKESFVHYRQALKAKPSLALRWTYLSKLFRGFILQAF